MRILQRLISFPRVNTWRRKKEEVHVPDKGRSQILYLPMRIPQVHAGAPGATIKRPPQGVVNVSIDGLPWKEVHSLDSCRPDDQIFVLNAEDGTIVFGDGVHGSQLPAGVKKVFSSYRVGTGQAGNLSAGQEGSTSTEPFLAYLDVWTREITAVEDASIREVALDGPDTSTRHDDYKRKRKRP